MNTAAQRLAYPIEEAFHVLGVSRSTGYRLINNAELMTFKVGSRRMVSENTLRAFVEKKEKEASQSAAA